MSLSELPLLAAPPALLRRRAASRPDQPVLAGGSAVADAPGEHVPVRDGRMPARALQPGEQYRFHFDMASCIGCKCCVVACNEQNGNPASINWRRVAEIEGGWYPQAQRAYLSMGCNHCVEPTCLSGCPVDAYEKDPVTGIVRHSADACIGCQYCTWNCSYGVPQYNPDRGVVGKCDMCHGRLGLGDAPACVSACPESAIRIEIVNVAGWRAACAVEAAPQGTPSGDPGVSTTRVTLPARLAPNAKPVGLTHVHLEHPHWPLVFMTVLTQLSVGAFATIWLLQLLGVSSLGAAAIGSMLVGGLALSASTLHLGRPAYAYRAVRMWRRSWLSREVLLFSAFSVAAAMYSAALWMSGPALAGPAAVLGALTTVLGIAGVTAGGCIYRVPSRPAWNSPATILQFNLTAAVLGPLFAGALGVGDARWLAIAAASMAGALFLLLAGRFFRLIASDRIELRGTARLLSTVLRSRLIGRGVLLAVGGLVLPLLAMSAGPQASPSMRLGIAAMPLGSAAMFGAALAVTLAAEILGRYLFFVSVVPAHMAAPYLPLTAEAA